jgi:uncharacterized protein YndB with AHSA1/START domain
VVPIRSSSISLSRPGAAGHLKRDTGSVPTPQQGRVSVTIAAQPQLVYDLLANIPRMGEWSPECYRCEWLDGATAAAVGARFRGYNRLGRYRWERMAIITAAEPGRQLSFVTVDDRTHREETEWHFTMEPSASGTVLIESFQFLWCPTRDRVVELLLPRGRQVERGMKETLRRLKLAAEAHQATDPV